MVKQLAAEFAAIILGMYLVAAGVACGWSILGLRDAQMMIWCLLVVVPVAVAPKFIVVSHFALRRE